MSAALLFAQSISGNALAAPKKDAGKDIAVDYQGSDTGDRMLVDAKLKGQVQGLLRKQGFHAVESAAPSTLTVSVSQTKYLFGTSASYWHFGSATTAKVSYSPEGGGPAVEKSCQGTAFADKQTRAFPSIRVNPVDSEQATYIDPDSGAAWGAGVQFGAGSGDPAVIAADKSAFQNYNWAATVDGKAVLDCVRQALAG